MYNDQTTTGGTMNTQFMEGTAVLDVAGEKIGTVSEHGVQDGYLVIHHGLLNRDVYIPLRVIEANDPSGVLLSITKDEALHTDWRALPEQSDTAATTQGPATQDTGRADATMGPAGVDTGTTASTSNVAAE